MPIIKRRCIGWIRIFAMFEDGFMTLRWATKKAGLRQALRLRICRTSGFARCAA